VTAETVEFDAGAAEAESESKVTNEEAPAAEMPSQDAARQTVQVDVLVQVDWPAVPADVSATHSLSLATTDSNRARSR
jgi:hypothetical protein